MRTQSMCGFCHELVDVLDRWCPTCGHNPHVARLDCDCAQCISVAGALAKTVARQQTRQQAEDR